MNTMSITLSDEMKDFIEAQSAREGYESASEFVQTLIRQEQKRQGKRALEAKLQEGLDSGPATPMTREDWAALRRTAIEGLAGETIQP